MKYIDYIYGEIEIIEPVVLELIKSAPMQRMKGVDQHGYLHNPKNIIFKYDKSRFSHSLGVYILLKRFGAPLEEQIAGLLHDVSHSAFSHCMDALKGSNLVQDYQDNIHEQYIKDSEIFDILKKYNLNLDYLMNDNNFPLKEKVSPDLCADRIDYVLRDAVIFNEIESEKARYFLDNLLIENNSWIFKNFKSAKEFRDLFSLMNKIYYAGLPTATMFYTLSNLIRHALIKNYISENDLYTTDIEVLDKINVYLEKDSELKKLNNRVHNQIGFINDPNDYEIKVTHKSRVIDPLFLDGEVIKKLSDVDIDWREKIVEEKKPKIFYLRYVGF